MQRIHSFILKSSLAIIFLIVFLVASVNYSHAVGPSLTFDPNTVSIDKAFEVNIMIDTDGNEIGGAGARIVYDTNKLHVLSVKEFTGDGAIFGDFPLATFDNNTGKAALSGIVSSANDLYTGRGVFGSITFLPISKGETEVKFEFTPGSTTDSNLAVTYEPGDILNEVGVLSVNITGSRDETTITPTPLPTGASLLDTAKKVSFIDKILEAIGLKPKDEEILDPYGPITAQAPKTDPNQKQAYATVSGFAQSRPTLIIFIVIVIILL